MMLKRGKLLIVFVLISGAFWTVSCTKKEKIDSSPSLMLAFSADTVFFDTVFSTVGSVTQRLLVYNNNNSKIRVSSIRLAGGSQSAYSLNIDGVPATYASDVDIPANDSIYIFVKVIVDPNNQNTPYVVSDSILFLTNGNQQNVKLVAWGQDAYFYKNTTLTGTITWDSLKPRVIYGFLRVDTGASLTLLPGVKMYFHSKGELDISKNATLNVYGNLGQEVKFQGDRLDPFYRDLPGQWSGIFLERGSRDNVIKYAIIRNGNWGITIDSVSESPGTVLTIDNTIIQNTAYGGIYAYSTSVNSTNCVIGNCGGSCLAMVKGGTYNFLQLTIGNYWNSAVRTAPALYISNYTYNSLGVKVPNDLTKAYFENSIIYGIESEEIVADSAGGALFNSFFNYCLIKTEQKTTSHFHYSDSTYVNRDPRFIDPLQYNYQIDSISPAIGKGIATSVLFDIKGAIRGNPPDLGAYNHK
jgi:hypothetical protein